MPSPVVAAVDVSKELKEFHSDIVYNVRQKNNRQIQLSLLFEHKSSPPTIPYLQLLDYMMGIWRKNRADAVKRKNSSEPKLTTVIPIIFYHGKQTWYKKPFHTYFGALEEEFKRFIPNFEYYLIDLSKYDDEFILNLKAGFLKNSLITLKHKNETEYFRKHSSKIFVNLEKTANEELTRNFILHIAVYLVKTTELDDREVIELIENLPTTKKLAMTGYEKMMLRSEKKGREIGEKIGIKKGKEIGIKKGIEITLKRVELKKSIEFALKLLENGMDNDFILKITEIAIETLALLRLNFADNFQNNILQVIFAKHLISEYKYLTNEDVATFSQLALSTINEFRPIKE